MTYRDLARRSSAYARGYRARGLQPGDVVLLVARTAPDFVAALLGAQDAGLLAVPCPPPGPLGSALQVRARMTEIVARCGARAVVDPSPRGDRALVAAVMDAGAIVLDRPTDDHEGIEPGAAEGRFAYCQFTSGSGGRAKGVLLTHANITANIRAIAEGFALEADDVPAGWLPLFHDMGIVVHLLMPLVLGLRAHLMSPGTFIVRPVSWLALLTRVRATFSVAPNFAYAVCARRVTDVEIAGLDLSRWRIAVNGAEPITRSAIEAFTRRFAPCGFQPEAMLPGYGLAESTVSVSFRRPGQGPAWDVVSRAMLADAGAACPDADGVPIASVGRPMPGHEVAILGRDGAPLPERRVGEIAVRGDSVMHGYLPGTEGEVGLRADGWLLTGDLGYLAAGELFVVGRKKDLIIRAGLNYQPQDVEEAAATVPAIRPGRAVAFAVPGDESEQVVLLVECQRGWRGDTAALRTAIREAVFAAVGFAPDRIEIVPANWVPLTSSGKVMRPEARRLFLDRAGLAS